jgi:hypothetical protein
MSTKPFFPKYAFADPVGPAERWFAWRPVKLWNGRWTWMRNVWRQAMVVHDHLVPHGGDVFFAYSITDTLDAAEARACAAFDAMPEDMQRDIRDGWLDHDRDEVK